MALVDRWEMQLTKSQDKAQQLLDAMIQVLLNPGTDIFDHSLAVPDSTSRRASIGCYVIFRMASKPSFGRTALMKLFYLADAHIDLSLGFKPMRQAAGPYDPWIEEFEALGIQKNWFDVLERDIGDGRKKIEYCARSPLKAKTQDAISILGKKQSGLDHLLALFANKSTEEAEIIATLFRRLERCLNRRKYAKR